MENFLLRKQWFDTICSENFTNHPSICSSSYSGETSPARPSRVIALRQAQDKLHNRIEGHARS